MIKQISVFISNQVGRLSDITAILADAGIDIRALSLADTADYGILRLIVDRPDYAVEILKHNGIAVRETPVIAARLEDKSGSLNRVLSLLNDAKINLFYAYAFISPVGGGACVILRPEEREKTEELLTANGIELMKPEEIHR